MDVTSCYGYFAIKGNFIPCDASSLLGIYPTKQWAIGDTRNNGSKYDFALWETGFTKSVYPEFEMNCSNIIRELEGKEEALRYFKDEHDVSFVLEIVPSIYDGQKPVINLGRDVIKFCYLTETDIDIDMYIYPFDG